MDPEPIVTKKTVGFFEEQQGELSSMRLMSFICMLVGILLFIASAIGGLLGNTHTDQATQAAIALISVAFTGKLGQKFTEK